MESITQEKTPREKLESAIAALGLTVSAEFVPFSQSRNKAEKHRSLNWRVTLQRNGRDVMTTDYSAGIAHCPAYKRLGMNGLGRETMEQRESIVFETEKGRTAPRVFSGRFTGSGIGGAPILPDSVDVVWSLAQDSDVLDYGSFEDWADTFGYDTDSRSAESTYRACLEIALKLRNAIGESGLESLRQAGENF